MRTMVSQVSIAAMVIAAIVAIALSARVEKAAWYAQQSASATSEYDPLYDSPIVQPDQWITSCTADGGTPSLVNDESDGGTNAGPYRTVTVTNDNATCINVGGDGVASGTDPVNVNTGWEIGTGAGCVNGPFVTFDGRIDGWACTSQGAALTDVRVSVQK